MANKEPHITEQKLLVLLSLAAPDPGEIEKIKSLVVDIRDWNYFVEIATFNKVGPISYKNVCRHNLNVSPEVLSTLNEQARKVEEKNTRRNNEAIKFLKRFSENNIPVALLKGVAFGETVYSDPCYKRMNDIDLLIHKKDLSKIYEIYDSLGYFYIGERISGDREKSDKISHLAPHFVSRDFSCIIGTQWGIKSPLSGYKIDYEGIWRRTRPLVFNGVNVCMLSPEDNLLHLCLHLGRFKTSLRDLMDIYNLIRYYGDDFNWDLFYNLTVQCKAANPVYFALGISRFLVPDSKVNSFLEKIDPFVSIKYKKALQERTQSLDVFLNSYSDHIQSIEKAFSLFDTTAWLPEKWKYFRKIWGMILWPEKAEFLRMNSLQSPTIFQGIQARILMPVKILDVTAGEIGWKIVLLLMGKTVYDLVKTILIVPFVKKKNVDSEACAKRMGIDTESIKKLMKEIQ